MVRNLAKRRGILAIAGTVMLVAANGAAAIAADQTVSAKEVEEEYLFAPANVTVSMGDTVTWTNDSDAPHTVTSDGSGPLDSDVFEEGRSFRFTFDQAGDFAYHCEIHPDMTGTVTVEAAADGGGNGNGNGNGEGLPPTDAATDAVTGTAPVDQLPFYALVALLSAGVGALLVRRAREVAAR